jgi:hypothetical protein
MSNFIGGYPQITEVGGEDLLPVIQGGELKNATKTNVRGYKVYSALLNQTGTSAPTITVLEDTISVTVTPSYEGLGYYSLTFTGTPLTTNKTQVFIGTTWASTDFGIVNANFISTSVVEIYTAQLGGSSTWVSTNGQLVDTAIEIRVYN